MELSGRGMFIRNISISVKRCKGVAGNVIRQRSVTVWKREPGRNISFTKRLGGKLYACTL